MNVEARRAAKQLPIACELPEERQGPRREELSRELFDGCELVRELEDGYEFVFLNEPERTAELARFIATERVLPLLRLRATVRARPGTHLAEVAGTRGDERIPEGILHRRVRREAFRRARLGQGGLALSRW